MGILKENDFKESEKGHAQNLRQGDLKIVNYHTVRAGRFAHIEVYSPTHMKSIRFHTYQVNRQLANAR